MALAGGIAVVLGVLMSVLPVPYVVLVPGPVTDTLGSIGSKPVVSASGVTTYPTQGHLFLTTVGVVPGDCSAHPTLWQALRAWWRKDQAVEPHQVICPPDESSQQVQQQNENDMSQSQRDAVTAALLQLGFKPAKRNVLVAGVSPDVPANKVLQTGDTIVSVDRTPVTTSDELRKQISAHKPGDVITIFERRF